MDYAYQGKHPPTKLAAMATASNACLAQEQPWLADSAATDHVTTNLNQLSFPQPYGGQDHLTVGNGQNLPITHIGKTLLPSPYSTLQLNNVLRVPSISSNLAFVHKICHDNHYWCYFDENLLSIQALDTGKVLNKMESIPSILIKPHIWLCLLKSATMLPSLLFLIKSCGTGGLVIQMIKFFKLSFQM